jgi:prepilin-type N-terminal cleavage/methylation domain-containing protein
MKISDTVHPGMTSQHKSQQIQGFTLIEAMVAAALLGLGFWGATALTLHSLQAAASSRQQNTALTLAQNGIDCFRSGPTLCPASLTWITAGPSREIQSISGTVYQLQAQVFPTHTANLQELQVSVDWHPSGSTDTTNNPMALGAGQLVLHTRVAVIPNFVRAPTP